MVNARWRGEKEKVQSPMVARWVQVVWFVPKRIKRTVIRRVFYFWRLKKSTISSQGYYYWGDFRDFRDFSWNPPPCSLPNLVFRAVWAVCNYLNLMKFN